MSVVYLQNPDINTRERRDERSRLWVEPGQRITGGRQLLLEFLFCRIDDEYRPFVDLIYPDSVKRHELIDGSWLDLRAYSGAVIFPRATETRDGRPVRLLLEIIHCRQCENSQPPAV